MGIGWMGGLITRKADTAIPPQQGSPPPGRSIAGGAHQGSPFREWMALATIVAGGKRYDGPGRHSPCRLRNGPIELGARAEGVRRGGGRDHRGSGTPPSNRVETELE